MNSENLWGDPTSRKAPLIKFGLIQFSVLRILSDQMLQSVYFVSTKGSQEHEKELSHNCGGGYFAERSGMERNGTKV